MKLRKLVFLLGLAAITACNDNDAQLCPVAYTTNSDPHTIQRTWRLIGFMNDSDDVVDYPPCEGYDVLPDYKLSLNFSNYTGSGTQYPYIWFASSGLNSGSGNYGVSGSSTLYIGGPAGWSEAGGPAALTGYEARFQQALSAGTRTYQINGNLLYIWYSLHEGILLVSE